MSMPYGLRLLVSFPEATAGPFVKQEMHNINVQFSGGLRVHVGFNHVTAYCGHVRRHASAKEI